MPRIYFFFLFNPQTYIGTLRRTKYSERSISKNIEKERKLQHKKYMALDNYTQFDMCRDEHSKETPQRCEKSTDDRMNHVNSICFFEIVFDFLALDHFDLFLFINLANGH